MGAVLGIVEISYSYKREVGKMLCENCNYLIEETGQEVRKCPVCGSDISVSEEVNPLANWNILARRLVGEKDSTTVH